MMNKEVIVLLCEDDEGHTALIKKNLKRSGITNEIKNFTHGQQVLDYLFFKGAGPHRPHDVPHLLLLDIRMPGVDGVEVLRQIKENPELRKMPVIMVSTTTNPKEIERCHLLGCSHYITKPVDSEKFINAIRQLGLFLAVIEVPVIDGEGAA